VARQYGFGTPTNLGLNGDAGGRIPTKAWYEKQGRYQVGYATNAATGQGDVEGWHPTRSHAWFAGWAPAEDPEIVIVVFVEHGGSGGRVAWPIAKQIIESY